MKLSREANIACHHSNHVASTTVVVMTKYVVGIAKGSSAQHCYVCSIPPPPHQYFIFSSTPSTIISRTCAQASTTLYPSLAADVSRR